jgi:DNA-binding NtrC family response regulator
VFPISVPPLSERPEDVPELTRHFLARFAAEEGKRVTRVNPEAMALLTSYRWPGNVRQLENAVFRAVVLTESDEIGFGEFPQIAAQVSRQGSEAPSGSSSPMFGGAGLERSLGSEEAPPLADRRAAPDTGPGGPMLQLLDPDGEVRTMEDVEAELIRFAITHYRGQMSQVARRLRIGRSTLYRKLDALGLSPDLAHGDISPVVTG